jgi:bifunctional UDP-N-acetylglucosamine pyrophosphorylase/glucosamine-1-phosphate N-acetyltransferase
MAIQGKNIKDLLSEVKNDNAAKEFYLTDLVKIAKNKGLNCSHIRTKQEEVLGVNSRAELAQIEDIKQNEMRQYFMEQGVTLLDPKTIYFAFDTEIANDVIIHQNVVFGKNVKVASGVEIKAFSHIEGAQIGANSSIGPFARIRPETKIGEDVKIGNFVEVKKSEIKNEAKISHLSYVGDSIVGENANIGAGTITCNYDGYKKFKTEIGKNVFIGSNSALIAPIKIKDNSVIGAGSVISKDVEEDELAVTRAKQINIKDGGRAYHKKKSDDK